MLCYATTIHKSQRLEYPVVVIPVSTQYYTLLKRNLIYTGITTGKRLVVLIGQKRALATAVKGKQIGRRWSKLAEWFSKERIEKEENRMGYRIEVLGLVMYVLATPVSAADSQSVDNQQWRILSCATTACDVGCKFLPALV